MSYVIHLKRPGFPDAWHGPASHCSNEREAEAFATRTQAQERADLCGLYRMMGWTVTVKSSRTRVNVPGPGSTVSY